MDDNGYSPMMTTSNTMTVTLDRIMTAVTESDDADTTIHRRNYITSTQIVTDSVSDSGGSVTFSTHAPTGTTYESKQSTFSYITAVSSRTSNSPGQLTSVTETETSWLSTNSDVTSHDDVLSGGLTREAIIGLAVGACAVVIIIILVALFVAYRNKKNDKRKKYQGDDNVNDYRLDIHSVVTETGKSDPPPANHSKPETIHFEKKLTDSPGQSIGTAENRVSDIDSAPEANRYEHVDGNDVLRREASQGPSNRTLLTESRYSLGPLILGGEDGLLSTNEVYDAMYSTNTFK